MHVNYGLRSRDAAPVPLGARTAATGSTHRSRRVQRFSARTLDPPLATNYGHEPTLHHSIARHRPPAQRVTPGAAPMTTAVAQAPEGAKPHTPYMRQYQGVKSIIVDL